MWQDLGRKDGMSGCEPCPPSSTSKEKKTVIRYPSFYLDLAEALPVEADSVIECKVKLKVRGFRKNDYNEDRPFNVDFDVMAIDLGDAGPDLKQEVEAGEEGLQDAIEKGLKRTAAKKAKE